MDSRDPFGVELRRSRMTADVPLGELARRTHYAEGYLDQTEKDMRQPSRELATQCEAALGPGILGMEDDGSIWFAAGDHRRMLEWGALGQQASTDVLWPTLITQTQSYGLVRRSTARSARRSLRATR